MEQIEENDVKVEMDSTRMLCRCCLSTEKGMKKIDSFREFFIDLADIIVSESDGLPQHVCWECSALLVKSARFKSQVLRAHTLLYDYHNKCAPFPIDGLDPELMKYETSYLAQTNILILDTSKSKNGFHPALEHEKQLNISKLNEIEILIPETEYIDDNVSIKNEDSMSVYEDDLPLVKYSKKNKCQDDEEEFVEIKKEKKQKKRKVKKKSKRKTVEQNDLDFSLPVEPNKTLRRPIEIDENKIRIIKLDPIEQLKQREKESKEILKFPFQCHLCHRGFNFESKLRNHMFKHNPARGSYKCELCSMYLPTAYSASVHSLIHTRRYECVQCGRRMLDRMAIVNHYRSQHEGVLAVFTCHICGKVSNNDKTHRGHMRNHHSGARVECDQCGKSFVNRDSLVEHQMIHQGIKNYECEKCGKRFRTRNQIRLHMSKHSDSKDYYCVECDVRFKSAHTLKQHLKRTSKHRDKKTYNFECSTCSKRFETEAVLAAHTRVQHLGVREHRCAQCHAALASRASLAKHLRAVHAGERAPPAHVCHTCGKMFRAKSTLVNHVRTHTGEKPYECATCGRRFAQRTAMRTHIKLVHLKIHRSAKIKKLPSPEVSLPKLDQYKEESPLIFEWRQAIQGEFFTVTAGS